ncbi:hypothetical protein B296_00026640 [Ensete ventricosum]|uniref:TCP domain-containing protein n=1 Tax=Ensete ventricosum TaxID=4639 RepID=A0A426YE55_ENSVE|nr:hypothetical protein B296_00026640 [Ensete ventricosum]
MATCQESKITCKMWKEGKGTMVMLRAAIHHTLSSPPTVSCHCPCNYWLEEAPTASYFQNPHHQQVRLRSRRGRRKLRETRSSSRGHQLAGSKAGTGAKEGGAGSGSAEESVPSNSGRRKRRRKRGPSSAAGAPRTTARRAIPARLPASPNPPQQELLLLVFFFFSCHGFDRHSKVCTAKGPRDRRVRLSAHTAIQFYDVQDRLGYDRPSKAVDWLMKNAKAAIDELAELPPWSPSATVAAAQAASSRRHPPPSGHLPSAEQAIGESSSKPVAVADPALSTAFSFGAGGGNGSNTFLPPSLDTDSIADTIKSFFPMAAAATPPSSSPSIGFLSYSPELPSRTSGQAQDLRLSLQSFQDPIFHNPESGHHHHHSQYHQSPTPSRHDAHFPSSAQLASDVAGWAEQSHRIAPWNMVDSSGGGGGYVFSFPPPQAAPLHSLLGQSLFFSQRGPLQSSNSPAVRAWADPVDAAADHRMQPALYPSMPSIGFASGASFSGFRIPARIQGEEEHDGHNDKPPSAASASRH